MALQYMATVQHGEMNAFNIPRVVNTKEIAEEHLIPLELLAKVLQTLAKYGMIESFNIRVTASHFFLLLKQYVVIKYTQMTKVRLYCSH